MGCVNAQLDGTPFQSAALNVALAFRSKILPGSGGKSVLDVFSMENWTSELKNEENGGSDEANCVNIHV